MRLLSLVGRYRYCFVGAASILIALVNQHVVPTDYFPFSDAGRLLWHGSWGSVFVDKTIQAGPIQLALVAAFRPLAAFHLDIAALHVVGSVAMGCGLMWAAGRLRLTAGLPRAPQLELVVALLAIWCGLVDDNSALGHPAQVVVPLLWMFAATAARRDEPIAAGVALAAATGFETWALLGIGALLLSPSMRTAARAAAVACAAGVALWLPFVLGGPFNMMRMQWNVVPDTLVARLFGGTTFTSTMRLTQLVIALAVSAVAAVVCRRSTSSIWLVPMTAVVARLAFDPLQFSYYWVAPLTLALLALSCTVEFRRPSTLGILALMYCQVIAYDGTAKELMIGASVGLLVVATYGARRRAAKAPQHSYGDRYADEGLDMRSEHVVESPEFEVAETLIAF